MTLREDWRRVPGHEELDALCASPWANVRQDLIPRNWRELPAPSQMEAPVERRERMFAWMRERRGRSSYHSVSAHDG